MFGQEAEELVFLCIILVGKREQTEFLQSLDSFFQLDRRVGGNDDLIQIIHRELRHSSVECCILVERKMVGHVVKADNRPFHIIEFYQFVSF